MSGSRPPTHYEIRVEGVLGEHWTGWFEGLQVSSEAGETILSGPVTDQPALATGPPSRPPARWLGLNPAAPARSVLVSNGP